MATSVNPRLNNLLASLTLNLGQDCEEALERASGLRGVAAQGLLALQEFLDGTHVGRLASALGLTHSGAVRMVAQLESAGLAERHAGADRRRMNVHLTAEGRRVARQARAARDEIITTAAAGLTSEEGKLFETLTGKVIGTHVDARLARRRAENGGAWWCRTCDFAACGCQDGRCPAQAASVQAAGGR